MPKGTRNKSNHKAPPRHIILVGQLQFPQKNVVLTIFGTKNTQTCFFREPSMVVKGIRNRSNHMAPQHLGEIAAICLQTKQFWPILAPKTAKHVFFGGQAWWSKASETDQTTRPHSILVRQLHFA